MLTQGLLDLRMKSSVLAATAVLPAAVFMTGNAGAEPGNTDEPAAVAEAPPPPTSSDITGL
ncbi:hypothetical protein [Mycolicibacter sinensis]|uniref:hypothetical protein n=1 Tax=Mycolicibacter sinensis (strain JDM601) TaxID=875328 RepID=UPI001042744C|nr:hypothetical protein [Mycolicibacter sinensis]